jgi:imidazolonepropionase
LISTFLCSQVSPDYLDHPERYLEWACTHMLPLIKRRKLAEVAEISCQEGAFPVEHARRYLAAARELKFGLKIHLGHRPQAGAIRMAVQSGVTSVDHATDVAAGDAAILAQSQSIVTLLPRPALSSGTPDYAPARMLIDAGAAVALASGYHPSAFASQNMQMMIALACGKMQMTPAEAVTAATFNGACAVRRSSNVGSLEAGKSADLLILSVPDYREIPYHFGVNLVELVMKSGAVLVERSEVKWPPR